MGKPTTKEELIQFSQRDYETIMAIIDKLSAKQRLKEWKTSGRDKNLRDILFHLHAWHQMCHKWLEALLEGGRPALPKEGYTWDDIDQLNHEIWLEAQKHPFMDALELFQESHRSCLTWIKHLSDGQIFTTYFPCMRHPINGLIDGCISDHYEWAIDLIKKEYQL